MKKMGWHIDNYTHPDVIDSMQDQGLVLSPEGEEAYWDFVSFVIEYGGCRCFISAPCSYCTHPHHPYSLIEIPEMWESDLKAGIRMVTKGIQPK